MSKTFLNRMLINAFAGKENMERGKELYESGKVSPLLIDSSLANVEGSVQDGDDIEHVYFHLDNVGQYIDGFSCTCDEYKKHKRICSHVTAAMISFSELVNHPEKAVQEKPARKSDENLIRLIESFVPAAGPKMIPEKPLSIIPILHDDGVYSDGKMTFSFQLQSGDDRVFPLSSLWMFVQNIREARTASYPTISAFTHVPEAFTDSSRKIIALLEKLFPSDEKTYYTSEVSVSNESLDIIMSASGSHIDFYDKAQLKRSLLTIEDRAPSLQLALKQDNDGYILSAPVIQLGKGSEYLYLRQQAESVLYRFKPESAQQLQLLEQLCASRKKESYLSKRDLPSFSTWVLPQIHGIFNLQLPEGYNAESYQLKTPSFELYLDYPHRDMLTALFYAVYDNERFNVIADDNPADYRDLAAEQKVLSFLNNWFTEEDHFQNRLILRDRADLMYSFLRNGLSQCQAIATVFVSDRMKSIAKVRRLDKFHIRASYHLDLLQLDLVSDTFTMPQLIEIMNRYDPKAHYVRLKDGEFVDLTPKETQELDALKKNLDEMGIQESIDSIELPKYRALYLEHLHNEGDLEIDEDPTYQNLILSMKQTQKKSYPLPSGLKGSLRPYQRKGFEWLCALRDNGFGGLLADEMGLGKTVQVIAFLGAWKNRGRTLIVCPASLVYNWLSEIERFFPSLPARMIVGSQEERRDLIHLSAKDEILITSYDLLRRDKREYASLDFDCEVLDEAQYIKNVSTQSSRAVRSIHSSFRIALTGTPIENKLSELYSIFDFLMPGFFGSYRQFHATYEVPIAAEHDEETRMQLTQLISPFILRRLKKDVLNDLPEKVEQVFYAPLEGEQKELYDARLQNLRQILQNQTDEEFRTKQIFILSELTRLRQLCCDPALIYDNYTGNSGKKDLCIQMIKQAADTGHKVLLFSQFASMLNILVEALSKEKIKSYLLVGSTPSSQRAQMVEAFQNDDVPVFAISLRAGGTGLNLTAADIVIHYDPWWNTAVENQASDRTHRIGQKNTVNVYRLIMKNTVEERILALQNEKKEVADNVLSGEGMASWKISREELLKLL